MDQSAASFLPPLSQSELDIQRDRSALDSRELRTFLYGAAYCAKLDGMWETLQADSDYNDGYDWNDVESMSLGKVL